MLSRLRAFFPTKPPTSVVAGRSPGDTLPVSFLGHPLNLTVPEGYQATKQKMDIFFPTIVFLGGFGRETMQIVITRMTWAVIMNLHFRLASVWGNRDYPRAQGYCICVSGRFVLLGGEVVH